MKKLLLFVMILALAIASTHNGWIECAKDAVQLAADVQQLVKDAADKKIDQVLQDLQTILNDIDTLKKDCGLKLTYPQINGWEDCTKDVLQISELSLDITDDIAHFNIEKLSQDVDALYEEVQKALKDCEKSTNLGTNWIQCAKDGVQIAEDVQKLTQDAAAKNIEAVIADLQAILNDINSLKKDCGISAVSEVKLGSWEDCSQDVLLISQLSLDITDDITHFNIQKLAQDVDSLYDTVQKALKDCEKSNMLGTNWIQCAKDGVQLAEDVQKLTQDAAAKNIQAVINDLQAILNDINALKKDCGISTVSEAMVGDWAQCLQDVQTISTLANAITDDIKHFNIIKLAEDVEKLSQAVNQALKDCTGQIQSYNSNFLQCGKSVYVLHKKLDQLLKDFFKKQQVQTLINDLKAIYGQLQTVSKECGIKLTKVVVFSVGSWEQCLADIQVISQLSESIKTDIDHFNIVQLAKDVDALYTETQKALTDCK